MGLSGFRNVPLYLNNCFIKRILHHQHELNEEIKIMCFICCFNVYFSRNVRKMVKDGNLKIQIYEGNGISSCRA